MHRLLHDSLLIACLSACQHRQCSSRSMCRVESVLLRSETDFAVDRLPVPHKAFDAAPVPVPTAKPAAYCMPYFHAPAGHAHVVVTVVTEAQTQVSATVYFVTNRLDFCATTSAGKSSGGSSGDPFLLACRFFDRECAGYLAADDLEEIAFMSSDCISRKP